MTASQQLKGLLAGLATVAVVGTAVAQSAPPNSGVANPATGAGQRSTQNTPMGTTGTPGATGGTSGSGSMGSTTGATGGSTTGSTAAGTAAAGEGAAPCRRTRGARSRPAAGPRPRRKRGRHDAA